jgi:hypothetical protein
VLCNPLERSTRPVKLICFLSQGSISTTNGAL